MYGFCSITFHRERYEPCMRTAWLRSGSGRYIDAPPASPHFPVILLLLSALHKSTVDVFAFLTLPSSSLNLFKLLTLSCPGGPWYHWWSRALFTLKAMHPVMQCLSPPRCPHHMTRSAFPKLLPWNSPDFSCATSIHLLTVLGACCSRTRCMYCGNMLTHNSVFSLTPVLLVRNLLTLALQLNLQRLLGYLSQSSG